MSPPANYKIYCAQRISGIIFIRHAQYRNIGKPNSLKVFGSNKTKALNRIEKIQLVQKKRWGVVKVVIVIVISSSIQ
jgi:hypothetical protein